MNKNFRLMFLRDAADRPVGCCAIEIKRGARKLNYQLSVLNPTDQFKRELSRTIALGRLVERPISLPLNRDFTMHDISKQVMTHIANSDAPSRAVKAAKAWLKSASLHNIMLDV